MDNSSFSQDSADSESMEHQGYTQSVGDGSGINGAQLHNGDNIIIVEMPNNGSTTTIPGGGNSNQQVLSEGSITVSMTTTGQAFTTPANVEVMTLDVDSGNVGWAAGEEGATDDGQESWTPGAVSQSSSTEQVMTPSGDGSMMSCYVCGDRASGYHYSVFSCEGCKGFFKRTVQKNLFYQCKDMGTCVINKFTRNSCQHCRFNKCLSMGMKKEAVREDRSPGGKHRHKRQRTEEMAPMATPGGMSSGPEEGGDGGQFSDSLIDRLIAARPDRIPKAELSNSTGSAISVNELMQYGYVELKFIVQWAKKVPGFQELEIADQMALLKSAFMELNVFRLAFRSMGLDNMIRFADNIVISPEECQSMGWGKELVNATVDFASRLTEINLDLTEFCILNAIVLTYPDAGGIQDKIRVLNLQARILDSLRRYMAHRFPHDTRRFGKMLLRLPALRTVSAKAAERFLSLTLDGSIQINDLVLEMIN